MIFAIERSVTQLSKNVTLFYTFIKQQWLFY